MTILLINILFIFCTLINFHSNPFIMSILLRTNYEWEQKNKCNIFSLAWSSIMVIVHTIQNLAPSFEKHISFIPTLWTVEFIYNSCKRCPLIQLFGKRWQEMLKYYTYSGYSVQTWMRKLCRMWEWEKTFERIVNSAVLVYLKREREICDVVRARVSEVISLTKILLYIDLF